MPPNTGGEARAYPRPLPNTVWLGKLTEEILEPDLPIVDPHHHLWDHPGSRYLLDELWAERQFGAQHRCDRVHPVRFGLSHQRSRGNAADRRKRGSLGRLPRKATGAAARPRSAPASSASPICGCPMSMRFSKGKSLQLAAGFAASVKLQHMIRQSSAPHPMCRRPGS